MFIAYDRLGREDLVVDGELVSGAIAAAEERYRFDYVFKSNLQLDYEAVVTESAYRLGRAYEADADPVPGRYKGYDLGTAGDPSIYSSVRYGFEASGRLESVTRGSDQFTYGYVPQSSLLASVTGPVHSVGYEYETGRNAMTAVSNKAIGGLELSRYGYAYDSLGRRSARTESGSALAQEQQSVFGYDSLGQVTASDDFLGLDLAAPGTAQDATSFSYDFDAIGNRDLAEVGPAASGGPLESKSYQSDSLNKYTSVDDGSGGYVPVYDLDGNLTEDERYVYHWNGENRLVELEPKDPQADNRLVFRYDYRGRRTTKEVYEWDSINSLFTLHHSLFYAYDGWNLVREETSFESGGSESQDFVWGLDLSGSMQGAGGVGGLLGYELSADGTSQGSYYPLYDANGNVMQVLDETGVVVAKARYGPFGELVERSGTIADENRFWFSTKYEDESDLLYYGFRYYDPNTGRWPSRDPIGEKGGLNLYGMVGNDAVNNFDLFGHRGFLDGLKAATGLGCKSLADKVRRLGNRRLRLYNQWQRKVSELEYHLNDAVRIATNGTYSSYEKYIRRPHPSGYHRWTIRDSVFWRDEFDLPDNTHYNWKSLVDSTRGLRDSYRSQFESLDDDFREALRLYNECTDVGFCRKWYCSVGSSAIGLTLNTGAIATTATGAGAPVGIVLAGTSVVNNVVNFTLCSVESSEFAFSLALDAVSLGSPVKSLDVVSSLVGAGRDTAGLFEGESRNSERIEFGEIFELDF